MISCVVVNEFMDHRDPRNPQRRVPGELLDLDETRAVHWEGRKLVKIVPVEHARTPTAPEWPWGTWEGRDLRAIPQEPGKWGRVVACLNIWNDLPDLQRTWNTWYPHVDHVIVVDGAYAGMPTAKPYSTDGTLEWLQQFSNVEIVTTSQFWETQHLKRTEYLERSQEGDLLFRIDADEFVQGAEHLRTLPDFDVGWAQLLSPLYRRPQTLPVLFKWRPGLEYAYRHHWLFHNGNLYAEAQKGGAGYDHALVPLVIENKKGVARPAERARAAQIQRSAVQVHQEERVGEYTGHGHEPLRILHVTSIDAGLVAYRLHTAINTTSPHESILAGSIKSDYLDEPRHLDLKEDRETVLQAFRTADIVHCHLRFHEMHSLGLQCKAPLVMHHHGTMYRQNSVKMNSLDRINRAVVRFVSNPELLRYDEGLVYLPNPVPVGQYRRLGDRLRPVHPVLSGEGEFRIAHSPTKRRLKGTTAFLAGIESLRNKGLRVREVLLEGMSHEAVLRAKATCHATFDSFWLGMQCSGLEAAAMGQPVIAGDEVVRDWYLKSEDRTPYTFADNEVQFCEVLERLVTDPVFYEEEAERVSQYVLEYHDYAAVTEAYLRILDLALGWRDRLRIGTFQGGTLWS